MGTKLRHIPASVVRTREGADDDGKALGIVEGYSAVYDEPYRVGAGLTESISQRAFDRSIRERSGVIPVFWAHGWKKNNDTPIGHAEVREDGTGLHTTAYLYIEDEPRIRSLYNSVVNGAIKEWSVGFLPTEDGIVATRTATGVNEDITDADLIETSLALKGMNPGTFVSATRADELEGDADEDDESSDDGAGEPDETEAPAEGGEPEGQDDGAGEGSTTDSESDTDENEGDGEGEGQDEDPDAPAGTDDPELRERLLAGLRNPAVRSELRARAAQS